MNYNDLGGPATNRVDKWFCLNAAGELMCADCKTVVADKEYYTEINPPGGFDRPQVLVCDACMRSGRWDHWIKKHFPNWPNERIQPT